MSDSLVWTPHPDPAELWQLVQIVSTSDASRTGVVCVRECGEGGAEVDAADMREISASAVVPFDPTHLADLDDLCAMNNLHEAPLLYALRRRFFRDAMYTSAGNILISVNPYRTIPGLFDEPIAFFTGGATVPEDIGSANPNEVPPGPPPHIYALANRALQAMVSPLNGAIPNQSVVVSGESGSGKTEASKYVMNFLIAVNEQDFHDDTAVAGKIRDLLVDTNVVFEAFGNAKTVRNDNSSRFGKYTRLQYSESSGLVSANTQTFLLEKSRLVSVGAQERNYHIFYQLVKGKDATLDKKGLNLDAVESFSMLTAGNCVLASDFDLDSELFQSLCVALNTLGFSEAEMSHMWSILASILHMGNIVPDTASDPPGLSSPTLPLDKIAGLLGVKQDAFLRSCIYHVVKVTGRSSISVKMLNKTEISNNINGLIKYLYSGIFQWIVKKLNAAYASTGKDDQGHPISSFIGILDIFGFETLLQNSFEQLCINFANERLQQQFNMELFVVEQEEYVREGLQWSNISFRDNQNIIDLIAKKPAGLLITLEEHGMLNRSPDDDQLLSAFISAHHQKSPGFVKSRFDKTFTIKHFAGDVLYNIDGFLAKNNDSLQDDMMELLRTSDNIFLLNVYGIKLDRSEPGFIESNVSETPSSSVPSTPAAVGADRRKKMASSVTVSYHFRTQLEDLLATLRSTKLHYIKCIKPNASKSPFDFVNTLTLEQLQYSGILEVVRIRREGYPIRIGIDEFASKFRQLAPQRDHQHSSVINCSNHIMSAVYGAEIANVCAFGRNKIFLRDGVFERLNHLVMALNYDMATRIQSFFRGRSCRAEYQAMQAASIQIKSCYRRFRCRQNLAKWKSACASIREFYLREKMRRDAIITVSQMRIARQNEIDMQKRLENIRKAKLEVQLWASSRFRCWKVKGEYSSMMSALKTLKPFFVGMRDKMRASKMDTSTKYRAQVRKAIRSFVLRWRISKFKDMCASDNIVYWSRRKKNLYSYFQSFGFCTLHGEYLSLLQYLVYFGSTSIMSSMLQDSKFTCAEVLLADRKGRNLFHLWAMGPAPQADMAKLLLSVISKDENSFKVTSNLSHRGSDVLLLPSIIPPIGRKEGWIKKKRPGNQWEKRWGRMECLPGDQGVRFSYFKSPSDYVAKGDVKLLRSEEACAIRRITPDVSSSAVDDRYVIEVFSPNSLAHRSKAPVMLISFETEASLLDWLIPLKYYSGKVIDEAAPYHVVDIRIHHEVFKLKDAEGDTPLHYLCRHPSMNSDAGFNEFDGHRLSTITWLFQTCGGVELLLDPIPNKQQQTFLHILGISKNYSFEFLVTYLRSLSKYRDDNFARGLVQCFNLIDARGLTATDYFNGAGYSFLEGEDSHFRYVMRAGLTSISREAYSHSASVEFASSNTDVQPSVGRGEMIRCFTYLSIYFGMLSMDEVTAVELFSRCDTVPRFGVRLLQRSAKLGEANLATDNLFDAIDCRFLDRDSHGQWNQGQSRVKRCMTMFSWRGDVPIEAMASDALIMVEMFCADKVVAWAVLDVFLPDTGIIARSSAKTTVSCVSFVKGPSPMALGYIPSLTEQAGAELEIEAMLVRGSN